MSLPCVTLCNSFVWLYWKVNGGPQAPKAETMRKKPCDRKALIHEYMHTLMFWACLEVVLI